MNYLCGMSIESMRMSCITLSLNGWGKKLQGSLRKDAKRLKMSLSGKELAGVKFGVERILIVGSFDLLVARHGISLVCPNRPEGDSAGPASGYRYPYWPP